MKIAHISDLHIGKDRTPRPLDCLEEFLSLIQARTPDVLVVSGDLVEFPEDQAAQAQVHTKLLEVGAPLLVVPGNHDVRWPDEGQEFDERYGKTPRVERINDVEFLLFDSFRDLPLSERRPEEIAHNHLSNGRVSDEQFRLMEDQMRPCDHRISVIHHHVYPTAPYLKDGKRIDDEAPGRLNALLNHIEFLDWCDQHDVSIILYGHQHTAVPPKEVRNGVWAVRGSAPYKPTGMARIITLTEHGPVFEELRLEEK